MIWFILLATFVSGIGVGFGLGAWFMADECSSLRQDNEGLRRFVEGAQ
jgi:hypothetical protein